MNGKIHYFDWAIFNSFLYVYQMVTTFWRSHFTKCFQEKEEKERAKKVRSWSQATFASKTMRDLQDLIGEAATWWFSL